MTTGLPFDDFRFLLDNLPAVDQAQVVAIHSIFQRAGAAQSLAPLAETAAWVGGWTGRAPAVLRPVVAIFAGNHGVLKHGVSHRPGADTAAFVELCAAGGAAVNQICIANDLGLKVFDLALELPTEDITEDAALDERGCAATMAFGMEAIVGGIDLVCLSDFGVGNAIAAAAILAALHGGSGADWVGAASPANDPLAARMSAAVDAALACHASHLKNPLEVLRRLGGREIAAIAGAILAARMEKVPVILDGFATCAAAAILKALNPEALDHCRLAAFSGQAAHPKAAECLGLRPMLDLSLGEPGVGAGLAAGMVKAAALTASGLAAALR